MESIRPRNLSDYLRVAKRRKLAIIIPALVVTIASAIAIKRLPDLYESSTFIIVESPQGEGPSESAPLDLPRRLATIQQQVTSRTRLEGIIQNYGLYRDSIEKGTRIDDVITRMRADILVDVKSSREHETNAFTISYRAADPQTAQNVTAELANQLIASNVEAMQSQASGEADVLHQRASELSSQLHDFEMRAPWLLSLKEDTPIAPVVTSSGGGSAAAARAEALRTQQLTVEGIKDRQYTLQQQLVDLDRRIAEQRQIVDQQKKSGGLRDNPTYAALIAKRAELQGQRDNLVNRQELTDKHPRVIAINDQIAAIDRQLAELRQQESATASQTPEMRELRTLESDRNRVKTELDVVARAIDRQVANPPLPPPVTGSAAPASPVPRDAGAARLAQDYLSLKKNYNEIIGKLQSVELKRQTIDSAKVDQFRVLDQANLPQLPVWPNRRLFGLAAVAVGLAVGACFAFIIEFRRFASLQDARDVEYYSHLPLLAAIPKTMTARERRVERVKTQLRLALGSAIAVGATFALTKLLIITNVFALIGRR
ncbi:MAG TPA: Wzz/FepE/Etk N-terminal domain-containing protein [Blastocatellia bacterium]|nr:Wzz/FepE/Etk N-terminal domain-containing protein [Blastocatellia bacterium]